jgi:hypothetical protein
VGAGIGGAVGGDIGGAAGAARNAGAGTLGRTTFGAGTGAAGPCPFGAAGSDLTVLVGADCSDGVEVAEGEQDGVSEREGAGEGEGEGEGEAVGAAEGAYTLASPAASSAWRMVSETLPNPPPWVSRPAAWSARAMVCEIWSAFMGILSCCTATLCCAVQNPHVCLRAVGLSDFAYLNPLSKEAVEKRGNPVSTATRCACCGNIRRLSRKRGEFLVL